MGSLSRWNVINWYIEMYGEDLIHTYEGKLLGKMVTDIGHTYCDYWIQSEVTLDNDDTYEVHYRWSDELEDRTGIETVDEGDMSFKEFVRTHFVNRPIVAIDIETDRDDYVYAFAYTDENKNGPALEIPLISIEDIYELQAVVNDEADVVADADTQVLKETEKVFYVFQTHNYVRDIQFLEAPISFTSEQLTDVMNTLDYNDANYSECYWADWSGEEDVLIGKLVAPSLEVATSLAAERYNLNMIRIVEVIE